ncbi:phosphoenolpyruvate synthase [Nocardia nepalensis]|uniref:phosphoenolpyruvate synthase n=1 Tax=Nocardia nepalensis TaxID=3375448 RepID=UPI003B66F254
MPDYIRLFTELPGEPLASIGGKARNLCELVQAGLPVPDGFCVTTKAFRTFLDGSTGIEDLYRDLDDIDPRDTAAVFAIATEFSRTLHDAPMPGDVAAELFDAWRTAIAGQPCAVRSSATAEDLASASFAGQYDTFLNIRDEAQLLDMMRQCWLSAFAERAIDYRQRRGIDHRGVELAVIVQRMADARAAGVMFTADPVSGHRRSTVINASFGLGESVVSGSVSPDLYTVHANGTVRKTISSKTTATMPMADGGTVDQAIPAARQNEQALPDIVIRELAELGRRIEAHFGTPQDVEWAWTDTGLQVLQSRPITSLFPTPEPPADSCLHLYFSFGHQQMMTEPITPLGQSVLRTYFPFGRRLPTGESTQMVAAGNRVFFDYTAPLHSPLARRVVAWAVGTMDAGVGRTVREFAARTDFRAGYRRDIRREVAIQVFLARSAARMLADLCWSDLDSRHDAVHMFRERCLSRARAAADRPLGPHRIIALQANMRTVTPRIVDELVIGPMSALIARQLLERLCQRWLGNTDDLGALDKAMPGNVTTEMGLHIGDLADIVRERPALLRLLSAPPETLETTAFDAVEGGPEFRRALTAFLDRYGMRGPGEIDIARPRWKEQPAALFASILANIGSGAPGEHRKRFDAGMQEAQAAATRLVDRVRAMPAGRVRARVLMRLIQVHRTLMALREHQKFLTVGLFDIYRTVIREEVSALVDADVIASQAEAVYLTLDEIRGLRAGQPLGDIAEKLTARRADFEASQAFPVPRLFTSDGEIIAIGVGDRGRDGVLVGSPVSAGVVEGRARIVRRPEDAAFDEGDILVAPFADPAWTPLFSAVRAVVLEVGGVMAHGAVVARELGLPAVVGIDNATVLIADGQRIRVDGSLGTVSIIPETADVPA